MNLQQRVKKAASEPSGEQTNHSDDDLKRARELDGGVITQDGVSRIFAARYRGHLLYDHDARAWFRWNRTHWQRDAKGIAFRYARELGREQSEQGNDNEKKFVRRTSFASGVERFAQTDEAFAITSDEWDRDPFLMGTPAGTLDLRSGTLRTALPTDMISKITTVAPSECSACPQFSYFLHQITHGDPEFIEFLQRWFGYCLTGDTREQLLCFIFGGGENGKGVLINVVTKIMGAYATTATMEAFTASKHDRHTTELAMLRGARIVTASETEEGRQWAEARIKRLTGGDEVTARFMHRDNFTYRPPFKIVISGNHRPVLRNVDDAIRRRFMMLPFTFRPERPDRSLEQTLLTEAREIFRWMIEGCLKWQLHGLNRPGRLVESTEEYMASQDLLGEWIRTDCNRSPKMKAATADLHDAYTIFARAAGERPMSQTSFSEALQNRGFEKDKNVPRGPKYVRGFRGIQLKGLA